MGDNDGQAAASCATEEALREVRSQIDHLEDNIHVEYPAADTPEGGEQRVRIEVRSPASLITVGAQGSATAEGVPLGPGGIAMLSSRNFGAQIAGRTCVTSGGLTVVHSGEAMRLLTQEDLGIASTHAIRMGTTDQDVEITAGGVAARDPRFTVAPAMDIPNPPPVDTSRPRQSTDSQKSALNGLWTALDAVSSVGSILSAIRNNLATGVAANNLLANVMATVNALRAEYTLFTALRDAAIAVGLPLDALDPDRDVSGDPKVRIHGAGGVNLSTPATVSGVGRHISFAGFQTVSIKAPLKVSIKSAGYTGLYGGGTVSVSAEGPAVLKSSINVATVSGKYAEVTAKETAALTSKKDVMISGTNRLGLSASKVAVSGNTEVGISSDRKVEVAAPFVNSFARRYNTVSSAENVLVKAGQKLTLAKTDSNGVPTTGLEIVDGQVTIDVGASNRYYRFGRDAAHIHRARFSDGEVAIHGLVIRR